MTDILSDLKSAAARKWSGDPAAQQAGLFARAADEIERLRAALASTPATVVETETVEPVAWVDPHSGEQRVTPRPAPHKRPPQFVPTPQQAQVRECNDNDSPWLVCKPCVAAGRCAKAQQYKPEVVDEPVAQRPLLTDEQRMALATVLAHYGNDPRTRSLHFLHDATVPAPQQCKPEWPCECDEQGRGEPGVTCGDCPRDYGHRVKQQSELLTLDQMTATLPDAERYRWLRANMTGVIHLMGRPGIGLSNLTGEEMDAAIDAAMCARETK